MQENTMQKYLSDFFNDGSTLTFAPIYHCISISFLAVSSLSLEQRDRRLRSSTCGNFRTNTNVDFRNFLTQFFRAKAQVSQPEWWANSGL